MSNILRVLHVFGNLNYGGAETMIMNIYKSINRNIIQFDFIVHTENECAYFNEINNLGGKVFVVPRYKVINHIQYINAWRIFFQNNPNYKIIHGHIRSTASIYLKIAREFGLKTISHSHSTSNGKGLQSYLKNYLQKNITLYSDYYFAPTVESGKWLFGEEQVKDKRFIILKNVINASEFGYNTNIRLKIREELQLSNKIVIGHVGSFKKVKNHSFLIDVFSEFCKINPESVLLLIGEGELETQIRQKVLKHGLEDNVIFYGKSGKVNEILQGIDIFVFPSFYEGLPVTLIEAQCSGLPILSSSNINHEVKITEILHFKNLSASPKDWALSINDLVAIKRVNQQNEVIKAGYDSKEASDKLTNFYLSIV